MRQQLTSILLILAALIGGWVSPVSTEASSATRLTISWGGFRDNEQESSQVPALLVGSTAEVVIRIIPSLSQKIRYEGITRDWPDALDIEVKIDADDGVEFSDWTMSGIEFRPYITWYQSIQDSLWRATGREPDVSDRTLTYHFTFEVVPELDGKRICIRARYKQKQGNLLESNSDLCLDVRSAATQTDEYNIRLSKVGYADATGNYSQAVALADSFAIHGWRSPLGLSIATRAATQLHEWDKALHFLQLNYETNGITSISDAELNPDQKREEYERMRMRFVEKKSAERQQRR